MCDAIVVGSGLSGSVVARSLAHDDYRVLVLERRSHIAGNLYDFIHPCGIRVQLYGPHIFHTKKEVLFRYVTNYADWKPYNLECMVYMNGKFTPSPFNYKTIDDFFTPENASMIKAHLEKRYPGRDGVTIVELLECEDSLIRKYANFLFVNDYGPYTAKQWGIRPDEIDVSVLKRVPVYLSYRTGYFDDPYQIMPSEGFTSLIENLLNHKNITVQTGINALERLVIDAENERVLLDGVPTDKLIIYTGAIDELLNYRFGRLPYRSLRFDWNVEYKDSMQPAPVIAYPQELGFTRITEYKKLPVQNVPDITVYAKEYPVAFDATGIQEPYYPIPTEKNERNYQNYRTLLKRMPNLYLCGRLADYKYYNMDQALEKALELADHLRGENGKKDYDIE